MSPRTKIQFRELRENKRTLIRETALKLFASEGYHNTTIQKIATGAGISKGLMYNYYESKEDLLKEIITDGLKRILLMVDPDSDGILTSVEMESLLDEMFRIIAQDQVFWQLYFSILTQPAVVQFLRNELKTFYIALLNLLAGYFRNAGHDDPVTDALLFGSILDGIFINYLLDPKHYPVEKIKNKLMKLYELHKH